MQKVARVPEIPPFESNNWFVHLLFTQSRFETCTGFINDYLEKTGAVSEYPIYCLGLIQRLEGKVQESFDQFSSCLRMNPGSATEMKQVARSLLLLGRHDEAIDLYNNAVRQQPNDWEIYYNEGLCYLYKRDYTLAEEYFREASKHTRKVEPLQKLAKVRLRKRDIAGAIDALKDAVERSPDQPHLLSELGLLYAKNGEEGLAFENLGAALSFKPDDFRAILTATSIIIAHGDYDVALTKYRRVIKDASESETLWNNIGTAFLGKQKLVAAISCLRRAFYLAPFNWRIAANLGVLYLQTGQYVSAFHHLSASIYLRAHEQRRNKRIDEMHASAEIIFRGTPDYSLGVIYGLIAVALAGLEDLDSSRKAHEQACTQDSRNPVLPFNYAVLLSKLDKEEAVKTLEEYQKRLSKYGCPKPYFDQAEMCSAAADLERKLKSDPPPDQA
ncbi:unnamed protein product [Calicophoron daubneyi]|uniref:Bardet-Biedl syndrome 4 n=1 Tax=Calicophoron daubneyi TaxID=300641 RepID=A0AAV2TL74_CALDB